MRLLILLIGNMIWFGRILISRLAYGGTVIAWYSLRFLSPQLK